MSNSEITEIQDNFIQEDYSEQTGEYKQDILIDKKKLRQIQKENFSLTNHSGFHTNLLEKCGIKPRKHHLYYGLSINERALEVSQTSNKILIPLLTKKDIQDRIRNIKPEIRSTLGWIHIGAVQIIIKATFREGLDTPIDLAIMDNKIINREEACLGILRGNLQYKKLKFNIYPQISCHMNDKDFDKTLSLIQDFKRKDFFKKYNRPYSITYMVSYAISNTHHSDCFANKDFIDYPSLFNDICQVQLPNHPKIEEIDDTPLKLDLKDNKPLMIGNTVQPKLTFTSDGNVICLPDKPRKSISNNLILGPRNEEIGNYRIKGEYYNGKQFKPINILIDTGANGNYISYKLCDNLPRYTLENPHKYINFNGETHTINEAIETIIKFGEEEIDIRLLIENEGMNDTLEIMLGLTFLENVKPYQITSQGIRFSYKGKIIYIPK